MEFGARTQWSGGTSGVTATFPPLRAWFDRISFPADAGAALMIVLINVLSADLLASFSRFRRCFALTTRLAHSKATTSSGSIA